MTYDINGKTPGSLTCMEPTCIITDENIVPGDSITGYMYAVKGRWLSEGASFSCTASKLHDN